MGLLPRLSGAIRSVVAASTDPAVFKVLAAVNPGIFMLTILING
jgi:hypothetical protein